MKKSKSSIEAFTQRKKDHIQLALKQENQAEGKAGFQRIQLMHSALPESNFADVNISTKIFGKNIATPYIVTGMTGGWEGSLSINETIAQCCEKRGWIMGVGSQRRQIFDSQSGNEWEKIRKNHPQLILLGNIGLTQLIKTEISMIENLASSLSADGMVIHTNPLQEALQVEGTPEFKGGLKALEKLCQQLSIPVILKETGCGFSEKTLKQLSEMNLYAVDISGYGGTHWGRIEGSRTPQEHPLYDQAKAFKHWGISTIDSLLFAKKIQKNYEIWASGGIKNGCDAAKALALGASHIGLAKLIMQAALQGAKILDQQMARLERELKIALFCTSCKTIEEMKQFTDWRWIT